MQTHRSLIRGIVMAVAVIVPLSSSVSVSAGYLNGNSYATLATRHVKTTKSVAVYRIRTGKYEAANHFHYAGKIKKGTKLRISHYLMSTGGWIITSKKYYHNKRTFFLVPDSQHHWYKK